MWMDRVVQKSKSKSSINQSLDCTAEWVAPIISQQNTINASHHPPISPSNNTPTAPIHKIIINSITKHYLIINFGWMTPMSPYFKLYLNIFLFSKGPRYGRLSSIIFIAYWLIVRVTSYYQNINHYQQLLHHQILYQMIPLYIWLSKPTPKPTTTAVPHY